MKPEWIPVINGDDDGSMFDPKTLKMVPCSPVEAFSKLLVILFCHHRAHALQSVSAEETSGADLGDRSDEFHGFTFVDKAASALGKQEAGSPSFLKVDEGDDGDGP